MCKRLEEDLIVERKRGGVTILQLIQPEKLLDSHAANYVAPNVPTRIAGKLQGRDQETATQVRKVILDTMSSKTRQ